MYRVKYRQRDTQDRWKSVGYFPNEDDASLFADAFEQKYDDCSCEVDEIKTSDINES